MAYYADLFVPFPLESHFTYFIPDDLTVQEGIRVEVMFGKKKIIGFVAKVHQNKPIGFEVKNILSVIDDAPIFDDRLLDICKYTAAYYLSYMGEVLSMALPSGIKESDRYKVPFDEDIAEKTFFLTEKQNSIFDSIIKEFKNKNNKQLLYGITGSGKTEIYISVIKYFLEQSKSVIYLVPEISLSSQLYKRLYQIFKDELIVYHSLLTKNQRLKQWNDFFSGKKKIVIGTRSAVFMQCPNLGAIIVDEEHDASFKEHSSPRYNARRIALYRANKANSLLLLGSATPSIETLYAAKKGQLVLHELKERYSGYKLPEIQLIKVEGNSKTSLISPMLRLMTKRAIDEGGQVIYLLNRRGFSPVIMCDECGEVLSCPDCNIPLSFHSDGLAHCHYCNFQIAVAKKCPKCNSDKIIKLGAGTQKIEENIINEYKDFRVFRLDQDSSKKKGALFDLIERMSNGEIDLLLGTQMVSKGFDFPGVTLVGILLADIGLNLPDFRATERIFSLLVQVAGRSGRGKKEGKVILQTLNDKNPFFDFVLTQDYDGFFKWELEVRKLLDYPPFTRLARLLLRGKNEDLVSKTINEIYKKMNSLIIVNKMPVKILGAIPATFAKIAKNYRYQIILKTGELKYIRFLIKEIRAMARHKDLYLEIDIDPVDML